MLLVRLKKIVFILFRPKFLLVFLRYRVLPTIEHRAILDKSLQTIFDVGANRGQFALAATHFSSGRILSFEPLDEPCGIFRAVFAKNPRVTLFQVGISCESGEREIHISKADDSSSFLAIGANQTKLFPGTEQRTVENVKAGLLSEFISPNDIVSPALLKLDVQGGELDALKSAPDLLRQFDFIYCECSFIELYLGQALCTEVISYLAGNGFVLSGVYNVSYDQFGEAIQADFFFKNIRKD